MLSASYLENGTARRTYNPRCFLVFLAILWVGCPGAEAAPKEPSPALQPVVENLGVAGEILVLSDDWMVLLTPGSEQRNVIVYSFVTETLETLDLHGAAPTSAVIEGDTLILRFREGPQERDLNGDGDSDDGILYVRNLRADAARGLWLTGYLKAHSEGWLTLDVSEQEQGEDLDADGDLEDLVSFAHEIASSETTNLCIDPYGCGDDDHIADYTLGHWLAFLAAENVVGRDFNGDGDRDDEVVHLRDIRTGESRNLGLAGRIVALLRDWVIVTVNEKEHGVDLNKDGDQDDFVLHTHDFAQGSTTNLGLAVRFNVGAYTTDDGEWLVFAALEDDQGVDLNGDGDTLDSVLHTHRLAARETTNLRLAGAVLALQGDRAALRVAEFAEGEDLNDDGDRDDFVVHLHTLGTDDTFNLGVEGEGFVLSDRWAAFWIREARMSPTPKDLNADGDTVDLVVHALNLSGRDFMNLGLAVSSEQKRLLDYVPGLQLRGEQLAFAVEEWAQGVDLNGDADLDDVVLHLGQLRTREMVNLGLATAVSSTFRSLFASFYLAQGWLALEVSEESQGKDLNGDGDDEDAVPHVVRIDPPVRPSLFLRGDCNQDGEVAGTVGDAVSLLNFNFLGRGQPDCLAACDADSDGEVGGTVQDAVYLLNFSFQGGPPPAAPFPTCGEGTESDVALGCAPPGVLCASGR